MQKKDCVHVQRVGTKTRLIMQICKKEVLQYAYLLGLFDKVFFFFGGGGGELIFFGLGFPPLTEVLRLHKKWRTHMER